MPRKGRADYVLAFAGLAIAAIIAAVVIGTFRGGERAAGPPTPSSPAAVVGSPTPRVDATPKPVATDVIDPRLVRIQWTHLEDRKAILFEDEEGRVQGIRIFRTDGQISGEAATRLAEPGEPRTCGHPDVIRPLVAVIEVTPEMARQFDQASESGAPTPLEGYRVEAQQRDGSWHPVETDQLLSRARLAGRPCFE